MGSVGNAVLKGMEAHHGVVGYDIDGRGEWDAILQAKAVIVCVPTDLSQNCNNLNMGPVQEVAARLEENSYKGLVIYKSTLNVGTMDDLVARHPQIRLVYMPEFLREKDAESWFADPDRLVASGDDGDVEEALSLFEWVASTVPRMTMKHMEAEIGKLAHNAYIATKVTFTCEIERLCLLHDVDPHPVMETVWRDRRVLSSAHLMPGLGGFDGKCVPKDTRALASIDYDNLQTKGLLHYVLKIGTKKSVTHRLHRATNARDEYCQQQMAKLSKDFVPTKNITKKSSSVSFIINVFASIIIPMLVVIPWIIGILVLVSPPFADSEYDSKHYFVDLNDSSFDYNEHDYLTFLSFNSSMKDNETTHHESCWSNDDGSYYGGDDSGQYHSYEVEQECESYTNYHPVLVNESGNYSFALSGSESFLDDCFQTNCIIIGRIIEVNDMHYWVEAIDYRTILE
jgi:UDPglucose 6-dehydrogenase